MTQDLTRIRFENPGHPYPQLIAENLGHLWVGPRRNDFAPALIKAVQAHLDKYNLPKRQGDAINAIRNRVLQGDWGWLEQRDDESKALAQAQTEQATLEAEHEKAWHELTPDEQAARVAAIQRAKQLARPTHTHTGDPTP
jgi:hypothetical protein